MSIELPGVAYVVGRGSYYYCVILHMDRAASQACGFIKLYLVPSFNLSLTF